jgi:hypothetical protein
MKHAGDAALDSVEDLLAAARAVPGLAERKRGIFYRKSVAILHFHEDPDGVFADVKVGGAWRRLRVVTRAERRAFLAALKKS